MSIELLHLVVHPPGSLPKRFCTLCRVKSGVQHKDRGSHLCCIKDLFELHIVLHLHSNFWLQFVKYVTRQDSLRRGLTGTIIVDDQAQLRFDIFLFGHICTWFGAVVKGAAVKYK